MPSAKRERCIPVKQETKKITTWKTRQRLGFQKVASNNSAKRDLDFWLCIEIDPLPEISFAVALAHPK
jgi:hypothetical protein